MGLPGNGRVKFVFILAVHEAHMKYLDRCISAIRGQSYDNWRIFLFYDGDGYGYKRLYNDGRIRDFFSREQRGQVHWINVGIEALLRYNSHKKSLLQGEPTFINFHGVDDYLQNDTVLDHVLWHYNRMHFSWCYGSHFTKHEGEISVTAREARVYDYKSLLKGNYIAGGAAFVDLELYRWSGPFRDLAFKQGADWDMWLRLGKIHSPYVLPFSVYTESLGTSVIRPRFGTLKSRIINHIKYPIWRIERELRRD